MDEQNGREGPHAHQVIIGILGECLNSDVSWVVKNKERYENSEEGS